jgi:DNA repair exonuclease SbcCD ATPase subunit
MDALKNQIRLFRNEIEQLKGQKDALLLMKKEAEFKLVTLVEDGLIIEKGIATAQEVAAMTQNTLKLSIEPIVASAMEIVYKEHAYGFELEFDKKSSKTVCNLWFTREGRRFEPLASSGFGVVDVAAFAMRLALWNISRPATRPVFILDEPFKHVSEDLQESVMEMVQVLSSKLGLQIIMVTHNKESDVVSASNKIFVVKMDNKFISFVKEMKERADFGEHKS